MDASENPKSKNDEYLMSNIVNICCFKKDFVLEEGEEVYYYAGENRLEDPVSAELVLFVK